MNRANGDVTYDWWSRHQRLFRALSWLTFGGREPALRRLARDRLLVGPGDTVLNLGCGPGREFAHLASEAGPSGRVVGADYSAGMAVRAHERARTLAFPADSCRADARSLPFRDRAFDRAYSALAVSAMADPDRVVAEVHRVLRPGGRFVVFDTRPFQERPWTGLNRVLNPLSAWATNWRPDTDVPALLEGAFASVDVESFLGGTTFVAVAERA